MTRRTAMQLAGAASSLALPAAPYEPSTSNRKAREWFQDAKFGLFVHWGVYSVLGKGEWVMNNDKMTVADYEKLPGRFNPEQFNAGEWVSMVKNAGQKYITITSKHHDGFAMWGTKQSKWNIVDATPYGKDPLKMLAEECRNQGVKLFFYHSHLDWTHPDYYPRGRTGQASGRAMSGDFNRYLDFMDAQLTELLTNYGEIGGIWFDGIWDRKDADWRLRKTYDLIHKLQPQALIGNNHHLAPYEGEDFQMFEKDLPGQNAAGFSGEAKVGKLPLETCDTIGVAWGYNPSEKKLKSTKQLLHTLVRAAGMNANFLLNVGPRPDGRIQDEFTERLREMGGWLSKYGESIYGTRGGPIGPRPWGVTTAKAGRVYVHLLDWPDRALVIPAIGKTVQSARVMGGGGVPVKAVENGLLLQLPEGVRDAFDTVIEMTV
jgi:alpha-L-fucosidase